MASIFKRKQGDSLWLDVTCSNLASVDNTWTSWAGKWSIVSSLGGTALLNGDLVRTDTVGLMQLQLGPVSGGTAWNTLAVGSYILVVEVNNDTVDYRHEEHAKVTISAQGLVDV